MKSFNEPLRRSTCQQTLTRFGHDLELNWPTRLLLDNGCSVADGAAADQIANAQFHKVTPALLAVDSHVEPGSISQSLVFVEVKPDCPDVARSERAFRAYILPRIPKAPFVHGGVKIGMSHCAFPVTEMAVLEMGAANASR